MAQKGVVKTILRQAQDRQGFDLRLLLCFSTPPPSSVGSMLIMQRLAQPSAGGYGAYAMASGIYLAELKSTAESSTIKLLLLK